MTTTHRRPLVAPGIFVSEDVERTSGMDPTWFARHESTPYMIEETCRILGVTKRHLAYLLGLDRNHYQIYNWCSSVKRVRLSSKYALRLSMLLAKAAVGVNFATITEIDWETGDGLEQDSPRSQAPSIPKATKRALPQSSHPA